VAVLFITHKFPPSLGGMQTQSYALINEMGAREKIYHIAQGPAEPKWFFFFSLRRRIRRMIKSHPDIDIIHANDAVTAIACLILTRCSAIKYTATIHGLDIVYKAVWYQRFVIPVLRRLHRVIVISHATAQACLDRGFQSEQIIHIPNGVDSSWHDTQPVAAFKEMCWSRYGIDFDQHFVIISVGRDVPRKGFHWFRQEVSQKLPHSVRYVEIGPRNKGKSSTGQAICLGSISLDELKQWYAHAHVFVMPNQLVKGDMEGFGLVALEAALSGSYVLASDVDGIPSAIHDGLNGDLLPAQKADAWVQMIRFYEKNRAILQRKSRAAREYTLQNFSWAHMVTQYQQVFKHLTV